MSSYDEFLGINSYNTTPGHANAISAQNDAINEEFELKANQLINNGWGVYEGQTLNGHEITMSGMLAYIHLVGYGNFTAHFLTSGGTDDPQDGNNIPGSQYLDQFAGYDTPFTVDHTIAESMHGGSGEDVFTGHEGNDTIDGRDGDDTYIFNPGDGKDIIIDGDGQGVLIFDGVSITGTAEEAGPNFEEYILENGGVTFTIRRLGADVSIVNSESSDEIIVKSIP